MAQAERRKFHYIYKTTCDVTGRFYIGMHSTDDVNDGYKGSGKLLWHSIRKHGTDKHSMEIVEFLPSRKELKEREAQIVNEEMLGNTLCMNLKLGGEGGWTKEHSLRGNAALRSRMANDSEFRESICKARSKRAKERFDRDSASIEEYRQMGIEKWRGSKHSPETIAKMKAAQTSENNSQFGTCWIYNEATNENKKIKKDELEAYVLLGWIKGRKLTKETI